MKKGFFASVVLLACLCACSHKEKEEVTLQRDGKQVAFYTLKNAKGMEAVITNFGGRIVRLMVPDRNGKMQDVVLGFDSIPDYYPENHQSDFGAAIGRYANRLNQGRIVVDGDTIQLPQNNGPHCLHGGPTGWQYQVYEVSEQTENSLTLVMLSPDGDNHFPGEVRASVTYTLTDENALDIQYTATSKRTTVINMTNHSYFNLNGDGNTSILNHLLSINADRYTPIDSTFIPVGTSDEVEGTPFDFRGTKTIGADILKDCEQLKNGKGYDHNWVLNTKGDFSSACARLESPLTGIVMEVYTTEPGMQVYTGNFLDGTVKGKGGIAYPQRSAVCLETQKYPDSPNRNWAESNAYLRPGETYKSHTKFVFSCK